MVTIDVVCEAENLPRIRLLQTHLQTLQVELALHAESPEQTSARIVYVPKRQSSRLANIPASPDHERIAIYLDADCQAIDADLEVHLHSWPARSSDPDVYRLAAHLKRPFSRTSDSVQATAPARPKSDRRALWGLGGLVLFVFGAIFVDSQRKPEEAATQELAPANEIRVGEANGQDPDGDASPPGYNSGSSNIANSRAKPPPPSNPEQMHFPPTSAGLPTAREQFDAVGRQSSADSNDLYCRHALPSYEAEQLRWYSGVASKACRPIAKSTI